MNSAGVVNDSMELDVDRFNKQFLGLFPFVQPSIWMNFLGPTYVFFDETLEEMSAKIPTAARVCLFHDKILNFHEDKIQQYCEMSPQEIQAIGKQ
ncbi:unnamed protein product [Allacma fusca]|uniref:Uncharacterized protein n=1 Tax=Allacma fusca TaxID=39272 RepID=A0A8J2P495_9HEXA|nr:unnamed protein product [Allacma fusca]